MTSAEEENSNIQGTTLKCSMMTDENNSILTAPIDFDQLEYSTWQFDESSIFFCKIIQNTTISVTSLDTLISSRCVLKAHLIAQIFTQEHEIS